MVAAQFPRSALGRSDHLGRLFDYLLDKSQKGEVCREADISIDIFGKSGGDALLDASTRVYVHRLRKKMDEFYAGPGAGQAYRLTVPKGEYRLAVEGRAEPADGTEAPASGPSPLRPGPRWIGSHGRLIITIMVSAALGAALILAGQSLRTSGDNYSRARQSHVWTTLLGAPRPLTIWGSLLTSRMSRLLGRSGFVYLAICGISGSLLAMLYVTAILPFAIFGCIVMFLLFAFYPAVFGIAAQIDESGRGASFLQGAGMLVGATGPFLAGMLFDANQIGLLTVAVIVLGVAGLAIFAATLRLLPQPSGQALAG